MPVSSTATTCPVPRALSQAVLMRVAETRVASALRSHHWPAGGIGEALTRRLLDEGYAVAGWDLAPGPLAKLDNALFTFRALDTRDAGALKAAVADARDRFGALHGLVSLAAIYKTQPFLEIDEETWERHFSINLKGSMLAAQAELPLACAIKSRHRRTMRLLVALGARTEWLHSSKARVRGRECV